MCVCVCVCVCVSCVRARVLYGSDSGTQEQRDGGPEESVEEQAEGSGGDHPDAGEKR